MSQGSWVQIVAPPCKCLSKPNPVREQHGTGSIWMCSCTKQWMLIWKEDQRDGVYHTWDPIPAPPAA